jgi:hypothetical protein
MKMSGTVTQYIMIIEQLIQFVKTIKGKFCNIIAKHYIRGSQSRYQICKF